MANTLFSKSFQEGRLQLNPIEIIQLKASSNYTFIHFANRKPLLVAKVLKDFEASLMAYGFIRTHRKYLINWRYVSSIIDSQTIVMADDSVVKISRRQKNAVLKQLHYAA
jgi:two-component system, LytTR family, response regulator